MICEKLLREKRRTEIGRGKEEIKNEQRRQKYRKNGYNLKRSGQLIAAPLRLNKNKHSRIIL
jgi:hypothetical protein